MRKSQKLLSMPIITISEGIQIGTVRGLVVNPENKEITALIIDQRGWFREQKIIPYNKITNIGDDAITIDQSNNVQKSTNLPEILKLIREKTDLIGAKVISQTGKALGQVDEYHIDEESGKIMALEISGKFLEGWLKGRGLLPASQVKTIGSELIVVDSNAEDYISKIDGGFQETFNNFKESTSTLWNSTRDKTTEFSKTLKDITKEKMKKNRKNTETESNQAFEKKEIIETNNVGSETPELMGEPELTPVETEDTEPIVSQIDTEEMNNPETIKEDEQLVK